MGLTKNQKKRAKKKAAAAAAAAAAGSSTAPASSVSKAKPARKAAHPPAIEVEYVSADAASEVEQVGGDDAALKEQFAEIFARFAKAEDLTAAPAPGGDATAAEDGASTASGAVEAEEDGGGAGSVRPVSKKQQRLDARLSVAELKRLVARPDVVEAHDVTAADPRLLVFLKSCRNTVPVPRHWCRKRKYLQGKRGIEKPAFALPDFIVDTGIMKLRGAMAEAEEGKKAASKARERMQPKMGKIDIDYQVLYNAFFKFQTKPKLTGHGDLYYESKEFEVDLSSKKPGHLTSALREALGMPTAESPPPWLISMQRYGPPPSYGKLRIPGLNAPIPVGGRFGFNNGEWGKPPVDMYGRPLYGNVFDSADAVSDLNRGIDVAARWGKIAEIESESEEEEDEEMEEEDSDGDDAEEMETDPAAYGENAAATAAAAAAADAAAEGAATPAPAEGESIELRKGVKRGMETPTTEEARVASAALYRVIEQRDATVGGALYGSSATYVVPSAPATDSGGMVITKSANEGGKKGKKSKGVLGQVDVVVDPAALAGMDEAALKKLYEANKTEKTEKEGVERRKKRMRASTFKF